jgi:hypothetical protein
VRFEVLAAGTAVYSSPFKRSLLLPFSGSKFKPNKQKNLSVSKYINKHLCHTVPSHHCTVLPLISRIGVHGLVSLASFVE